MSVLKDLEEKDADKFRVILKDTHQKFINHVENYRRQHIKASETEK